MEKETKKFILLMTGLLAAVAAVALTLGAGFYFHITLLALLIIFLKHTLPLLTLGILFYLLVVNQNVLKKAFANNYLLFALIILIPVLLTGGVLIIIYK